MPAYVPDINACSNTQTPSLATKPKKSLESGERRLHLLFHMKKRSLNRQGFLQRSKTTTWPDYLKLSNSDLMYRSPSMTSSCIFKNVLLVFFCCNEHRSMVSWWLSWFHGWILGPTLKEFEIKVLSSNRKFTEKTPCCIYLVFSWDDKNFFKNNNLRKKKKKNKSNEAWFHLAKSLRNDLGLKVCISCPTCCFQHKVPSKDRTWQESHNTHES